YVEHRRLVALALPDDDLTVDLELVEDGSHGVSARLVDELRVPLAGAAAGSDRRLLGDADGVQYQGALEGEAPGVEVFHLGCGRGLGQGHGPMMPRTPERNRSMGTSLVVELLWRRRQDERLHRVRGVVRQAQRRDHGG